MQKCSLSAPLWQAHRDIADGTRMLLTGGQPFLVNPAGDPLWGSVALCSGKAACQGLCDAGFPQLQAGATIPIVAGWLSLQALLLQG